MIITKLNIIILYASLTIIILVMGEDMSQIDDSCERWKERHLLNSTEYHINNDISVFVKIDEINDLNVPKTCLSKPKINSDLIKIYSTKNILLHNDLDFKSLISLFRFPLNYQELILFQNVKGFNFRKIKQLKKYDLLYSFDVIFMNAYFEFYINGTLITKEMCFKKTFENHVNFFGTLIRQTFDDNIFYNQKICPYVFVNNSLEQLILNQITNSLIFRNRLEFMDIDENKTFSNSLVFLQLNIFYDEISSKLLNKFVFANLKFLSLTGLIDNIENNLFNSFKKIRCIILNHQHFRRFFQQGTKWMNSLNSDIEINLNNKAEIQLHNFKIIFLEFYHFNMIQNVEYVYPDEDICLFKDIPFSRLVFPIIKFKSDIPKCTCTLIWLVQYSDHYINNLTNDSSAIISANQICFNLKFKEMFGTCNFTERFKNCYLKESIQKANILNNFNSFFLFKWFQYVIEVYFRPIMCFLGVITNILALKVIRNPKIEYAKHFKTKMYSHIQVNCLFNTVFCLLHIFSLINVCIFPKSSFCSYIYKLDFSQNFKIYVILYLGNVFRLCCNFSYIFFSISRTISTVSLQNTKLGKFNEKLNIKKLYLVLFVFNLCLSLFRIFEYKPNEIYSSFDKNFPFNAYDIKYCESEMFFKDFKILPKKSHCNLFRIFNLINNILNNVIFLFLSLIIDITLIRFSNNLIKQKIANNCPHLDEAIQFKKKINKMIVLNGTVFFFSHFPEFIFTILLIRNKNNLFEFCFFANSCSELIEMSQALHFISISFQFFVFISFDNNFKTSFFGFF